MRKRSKTTVEGKASPTPNIQMMDVDTIRPDETNPRKAEPSRLHLLMMSLSKLGFVLPIVATPDGLVLSGHQRLRVSKEIGFKEVPVQIIDIPEKDIRGINVLFNRCTNDFGALDTGSGQLDKIDINDVVQRAQELPDYLELDDGWSASQSVVRSIRGLGAEVADQYDKKAVVIANNMLRKGIYIPIVVSESGKIVNGVHRLFAARESGYEEWPIVTIPDDHAEFAKIFLNYLSMDYHVDEDFADVLRYSAYRRPQNNRGSVPKAMRFWSNGEKTLPDKDSYSSDYWRTFRDLHGETVCDFGAGLCKVAPFLATKGINCVDFEPFRIDPDSGVGKPSPEFSRLKAREFLEKVKEGIRFDSIFLASVLNSIPFPRDRMAVLVIVAALSNKGTATYGTCRDISDFEYEYGGIRQANYFKFDSEPGVRLGDSLANPKIQKFHTQEEFAQQARLLWTDCKTWPGGNVFYWRVRYPKRVNPKVLREALLFEFHELPYSDGSRLGLGKEAIEAFNTRLNLSMELP